MSFPLVSIVIPFYNEERFLERAILSAIHQTYPCVEIILVNDGSTDASIEIAAGFANKHQHIQIIDAPHHSLGNARNLGIEKASGTYIVFLDSDDELETNAIEILFHKMEQEQADLVVSRFSYYDAQQRFFGIDGWHLPHNHSDSFTAVCGMYEHRIASTAWAKLYKMETVKSIRFPEGLWFEDRPFLMNAFLLSQKICYEEKPLWKIHSRPESITRRLIEEKRIADCFHIFNRELNVIKGFEHQSLYLPILFRHHIRALMSTLLILTSDRNKVNNAALLQKSFNNYLNDFLVLLKSGKIDIGRRATLDLFILRIPGFVGWTLGYGILSFIKAKKINLINRMRSS